MLSEALLSKQSVVDDPEERKLALHQTKVILTICLRDLIRQISVGCVEMGALLEKVLSNYINIFETEMKGNLHDLDSIQRKHLEDTEKVKEDQQKYINNLEQRNEEFNAKISQFREINAKYHAQVDILKEEIKQLTESATLKEEENRELSRKLLSHGKQGGMNKKGLN